MSCLVAVETDMIDLHCHSHFSDGLLSPSLLIDRAVAAGLRIVALTDHDTVAGLASFKEAAKDQAIQVIDGIELSVRWKKYDIHILGLHINPEEPFLLDVIKQQNESRIRRAHDIAQCLEHCGLVEAYSKACALAGHERVGRPHFAQVLINEGMVADMKTAFKRYLGRGKPAYVPVSWISIEQAVKVIKQAGGHAVIAHPLKYKLTRSRLNELIVEFKAAGGAGLEVVSGLMNEGEIKEVAGLCLRFDLAASTGSDYHGDNLSSVALGRQRQLPLNCTPIWHRWV